MFITVVCLHPSPFQVQALFVLLLKHARRVLAIASFILAELSYAHTAQGCLADALSEIHPTHPRLAYSLF